MIPLDSSFSPVIRVKYDIEETRVGQKTNYDRLVMETLDQRHGRPADGGGREPPRSCAST